MVVFSKARFKRRKQEREEHRAAHIQNLFLALRDLHAIKVPAYIKQGQIAIREDANMVAALYCQSHEYHTRQEGEYSPTLVKVLNVATEEERAALLTLFRVLWVCRDYLHDWTRITSAYDVVLKAK